MSRHYIEGMQCPDCKGKMIMYYGPYCPSCIPVKKVKKNLIQSISYIEHKYNIETRDYGATKLGVSDSFTYNEKLRQKWLKTHFPFPKKYTTPPLVKGFVVNKKGLDWLKTQKGTAFDLERNKAYSDAPDGECKEIPYLDWWHLFCSIYDFTNDCKIVINYQDILDSCDHDWQREITQLFVNEFGKKDIVVEISW